MAKMTEKITARAAPVRLLPFFCLSERKSISVIKVIMRSMTPAKMMCLAEKIPAVTIIAMNKASESKKMTVRTLAAVFLLLFSSLFNVLFPFLRF